MKEIDFALMLMKDGKISAAKDMLADLLESDPQNPDILFHLGMCYSQLDNPEKAVQVLSACVKHHSGYADAYVALGYAYALLRENGPAREHFQKALEIEPENSFALQNLGSLYGMENDFARAIECFEKSLAVNPADQQTAYCAGYACFQTEKFDLAEKYLGLAVDLDRSTQLAEAAMEMMRSIAERSR
ncbi:MAG: tetratricopeptide repeat protein [Deltaproteobacteria bacterium]|jgi:tetratricopeptide (TPR) repeat protein